MKNIQKPGSFFFSLFCCLLLASSALAADKTTETQTSTRNVVLEEIATKLVSKMPDDIHLRLLGIAAIEGDDGTLVDMITAKIKANTKYHLIERQDLNKILQEQGIQLSPYMDSRSPVEPGKIKGVEGLLLGKIVKDQCSFLTCNVDVFFKLNDVEGGEVVFADNFSSSYTPRTTTYGGGLIVAFIVILWLSLKIKSGGKALQNRAVRKDNEALIALQNELKKVRDNLVTVHDELVAADAMEQSVAARNVKEGVVSLLAAIEQAPGLHIDDLTFISGREATSSRKNLAARIKDISKECERLRKAASAGNKGLVSSTLETLKKETLNASNCLHERKVGQA